MKKTVIVSILSAAVVFCSSGASAGNWQVASEGTWRLNENYAYESNKGSASHLLTLNERVQHHVARIKVQQNIVDSFSFSVGCMLQSKTPAFTLKVPPLDISLMAQSNGYAFARMIVDRNEEFSLRGQVQNNGGIVFAPMTSEQDKVLSNLFLQLREGAYLTVALLQDSSTEPRFYTVPLEGFMAYSETILKDCERLNQIAASSGRKFEPLPDYLTREPAKLAPLNFTLKFEDKFVDKKKEPVKEMPEEPEIVIEPEEEPVKPQPLDFVPDGSPASIGADGKPIITDDGKKTSDTVGELTAPSLEFDKEGNPVFK